MFYDYDIISDIDGTLADLSHRLHHIKQKPKNWPAFLREVENDLPITPMINMIRMLRNDNRIIISSGRSDDTKAATVDWLNRQGVGFDAIYMRKTGDYRGDDIVKFEMLEQMRKDGYNPTIAFDDRPRVVKMWRQNGIYVFDVNQTGVDF